MVVEGSFSDGSRTVSFVTLPDSVTDAKWFIQKLVSDVTDRPRVRTDVVPRLEPSTERRSTLTEGRSGDPISGR